MDPSGDFSSTSRVGSSSLSSGIEQTIETRHTIHLMNGTDALITLIVTREKADVAYRGHSHPMVPTELPFCGVEM